MEEEDGPRESKDAYDWSIDGVVSYLCFDSFDAWNDSKSSPPRPDPRFLEKAIRDNDIDGKVLLTEVSRETLSNDLGIKSLGQRATIFNAIQYLRESSTKCRNRDDRFVAQSPSTFTAAGTPVPAYNSVISSHNALPFPWPYHSPGPSVPAVRPPVQPLTPSLPTPKSVHPPAEHQPDSTTRDEAEPTNTKPLRDLLSRSGNLRRGETQVVDRDGKKRRKLTLAPTSSIRRRPAQDKSEYLGREKLTAPDVFYNCNNAESDDDSDKDEFSFTHTTNIPTGKRLFVKQRMQYYYRQHLQPLSKDGRKAFALLPYNSRVVEGLKIPQYFTLFAKDIQGRISVTKEDSNDWPQLEGGTNAFHGLLKKYPANVDDDQGADDLLPLYGDSASDGDYDSDTWREIEAERHVVLDQGLDTPDVDVTIDECIGRFVATWDAVHRPVEERKATKIWVRSRKYRTKNKDVKAAATQIAYLNRRLQKLRQAVKESQWSKVDEVRQQCQCMERTVFDREQQKWKISVLELDKCPPKSTGVVQDRRTKKRPHIHDDDEESLDSDSSKSGDADDEGDFIVPDDTTLDDNSAAAVPLRQPDGDNDDDDGDDDAFTPSQRCRLNRTARNQSLHDTAPDIPPPSTPSGRKSHLPTPRQKETPRSVHEVEVVDLTALSDDNNIDHPDASANGNEADNSYEVHTPPLNPTKDVTILDTPTPSKGKSMDLAEKQNHESREMSSSAIDQSSIAPDQTDIDEILRTNWTHFEEKQDRKRLLIKLIYSLSGGELETLRGLFQSTSSKGWKKEMRSALTTLLHHPGNVKNVSGNKKHFLRMASWYVSFVNCERPTEKGIKKKSVEQAMKNKGLRQFYPKLVQALKLGGEQRHGSKTHESHLYAPGARCQDESQSPILMDGSDGSDGSASRNRLLSAFQRTPKKKRKRPVMQSQEAMDSQRSAQRRVELQEYQQKRLASKLESMGVENGDPERQPVSFEEPVIYLDHHIGRRVKPHQLNGIQFMWREIIKDEKHQGCLLAHTMGLGKTMQVISFLVTVANAGNSADSNVKSQVPDGLRQSRTLVLCPSSLIDNWWEELLMWIPRDAATKHNFGELKKVQPTITPSQRLNEISEWFAQGGVLLISYDIFRTTVLNRSTKNRPPPLSSDTHETVRKQLLEGPNIVVADEAHKMKNQNTGLAEACCGFKTKSRIALTGSPLANNLTDYFAMIDWIAPKYLGSFVQFKAKYVEPIEAGLYSDSTSVEQRQSLKKLQVLKKDLDPKVNRHDISALEGSLPPKVEFVITAALTPFQKQVYSIYIAALQSDKGDAGNTKIWHWMSVLSLLCNHPACFRDKVLQAKFEPQKTQRVLSESDSETFLLEKDPVSDTLPPEVLAELNKVFETAKDADFDSPSLSHRARILHEIIDESTRLGDKILVFSHSLPTLDYIERLLTRTKKRYCRLDGKTPVGARQASTKNFNQSGSDLQVYLISTRAGGLGLNIPGANRVVLFDFQFNPTWEEQAVGRTYRLGQNKPVFVYRFVAGGTFEDIMHNKAVFKTQLAFRVVDKKNPIRWASRNQKAYLFDPKDVKQEDLSEFKGKDIVLDKVLEKEEYIQKIELTETFQREDNDKLTAEEEEAVQAELEDERLKRNNPQEWARKNFEREKREEDNRARYRNWHNLSQPYVAGQSTSIHSHPQQTFASTQPSRPYQSPTVPPVSSRAPYVPLSQPQTYSATQPIPASNSTPAPLEARSQTAMGQTPALPPQGEVTTGSKDVQQDQSPRDGMLEEMADEQQKKDQLEDTDMEMIDTDKPASQSPRESETNPAYGQL